MAITKKKAKVPVAIADIKSKDELLAALVTAQAELNEAKRSHAKRELANTGVLKELRIRIAQLYTALNKPEKQEEKA